MESAGTFTCPRCGYRVAAGTPTCGNCGTDLRPYFGGDPLGNPATKASPRLIAVLALATLSIGVFVAVAGPIKEAVEGVTKEFEGRRIPPQPVEEMPDVAASGYRKVRHLIVDLKAGGLPCNQMHIDSAGPPVETGSCQSRGTHVQVNVYLTQPSLRSARSIFRDWPSTHVHAENWWVITTDPVAKHVRRILGGKLTRGTL